MAIKKLNLNGTEYQLDGESQGGGESTIADLLPIKLAILGDSIATENMGFWRPLLEDKYGIEVVANLAVGGSTYAHQSDTEYTTSASQVITNQVNQLVSKIIGGNITKPDVVLIHAGINDRNDDDTVWGDTPDTSNSNAHNYFKLYGDPEELFYTPKVNEAGSYYNMTGKTINTDYKSIGNNGYLGDMNGNLMTWAFANTRGMFNAYKVDNTAPDARVQTLVGGMKFAIETLRMSYPDIKVIVTTPIYTTQGSPNQVRHINTVIKKAASYMSVPVIDLTYESQMSPWLDDLQSADGLHPNYRGAMFMAESIGAGLVRHFGFVQPFDKGEAVIDFTVTDGNGNPVGDYLIDGTHGANELFQVMCGEHFNQSAIVDNLGYREVKQDGTLGAFFTDANGRLRCKVAKQVLTLRHTEYNPFKQHKWTSSPLDMITHESATVNIVWRGWNSSSSGDTTISVTYDNVS